MQPQRLRDSADTPQQQVQPSITWLAKTLGTKSYYLIGNDYVWPRKTNEQAKKYISAAGGQRGRRGIRAARRAQQVRGRGNPASRPGIPIWW